MNDEDRSKWILNYVRAMQQELAELTDSFLGNGGRNISILISKMPK